MGYQIETIDSFSNLKFSIKKKLTENKVVPVQDKNGKVFLIKGWVSPRIVKESLQYQLRAYTEAGEEVCSMWYDSEDELDELSKAVEEKDKYETTQVYKRIKELVDMDEEEDETKDQELGKLEKEFKVTPKSMEDVKEAKRYHSGLAQSTADKRKAQFNKQADMPDDDPDAYKPAPGDKTAETKPSKYTKKYDQMFGESKSDMAMMLKLTTKAMKTMPNSPKQREIIKQINDYRKKLGMDLIPVKEETVSEESAREITEKIDGLEKKAKETGISYSILKDVYDRGMAAWKSGHRPGTTPHQWAFARVNSFVTGGKTQKTADADLWAKVDKGSIKKESVDLTEQEDYGKEQIRMALAQLDHIDEYARKTMDLVRTQEGLEAWVASKITKIDDYMESVYHWLAYKIKDDSDF
jgi:hypothetical protein